jgi:subtilisin family serine protease
MYFGNVLQKHGFILTALMIRMLAPVSAHGQSLSPRTDYVEGDAIVTFRKSVELSAARNALGSHSASLQTHFSHLSEMGGRHMGVARASGKTTEALIAELKSDPAVESAEPNYLRWVTGAAPNDTLFSQLWAMRNTGQTVNGTAGTSGADIKFLPAWNLARPSTNPVVVAIIDTGIDFTHPDLAANVWTNSGEISGNSVDDDGNGYVDDYYGYDFASHASSPYDSGDHGTHVAGTIAAVGKNAAGVIGVNYRAKLMALKASSDGSSLTDAAVIEAIQYATLMKQRGVNIVAINASFGGGGSNSTELAAIKAAGDAGIIFCAAAGNETNNNDTVLTYPASYRLTNMIVVAASDQSDALTYFSNYGASTVDLAAPGMNILSAMPVALATASSSVVQGATTYAANVLTFSGISAGTTATIYDCGLGYPTNFTSAIKGNIALISRGTLTFANKVANAMAAGAVAAIIYNSTSGSFSGTLQTAGSWIPAISISQADGATLKALTPATGTVINNYASNALYQYMAGTSMATPHVVGAVAFAAMNFTNETVPQRVQRVVTNVDVIAGLKGKVKSGGRLNLQRIVDTDTNGLPDWWELANFNHLTGTDPAADPDQDGLSNLQEFLADTNPNSAGSRLRLTSLTNASNSVTVRWQGGSQSRQYLERETQIGGASAWVDVFTNEPPTATNASWAELAGTNRAGFYRLRAERP